MNLCERIMAIEKCNFPSVNVLFFYFLQGVVKKAFAEWALKITKLNNGYLCFFISPKGKMAFCNNYFWRKRGCRKNAWVNLCWVKVRISCLLGIGFGKKTS